MRPDVPKIEIVKEFFVLRIIVLGIFVVGLIAGVVAVLTMRDTRSRAVLPTAEPTPVVEILTPPPLDAVPPYIRMVSRKQTYGFNARVPVDIYLNTAGIETMELNIVITYDKEVLGTTLEDITFTDVYKTIGIESADDGKVAFVLFVNPTVGHKPVATNTEVRIATVTFKTKALESKKVALEFDYTPGSSKLTSLTPYMAQRQERAENILKNVSGTNFAIEP